MSRCTSQALGTTISRPEIRAVLLDLSGTLHIDKTVIEGAISAVARLRKAGKRVRFLTNTSKLSSQALLKQLKELGLIVQPDELLTSTLATRNYLVQHNLRPFCIMEDVQDFITTTPQIQLDPPHDCVVVGLAPTKFNYENMNQAFRILLEHPRHLVAIHKGKYYRDADGSLSLGPGGFVTGLEMATNCQAVVMGKPSKEFFESALLDGIPASQTAMVGDDVVQDVLGATEAGMGLSILVQTGKYRPGDEVKIHGLEQTVVCRSIVEAVDYILQEV